MNILKDAYLNVEPAALQSAGVEHFDGWFDEFDAWHNRPGLKAIRSLSILGIDGVFWWADKGYLIAVAGGQVYAFTSLDAAPTEVTAVGIRLEVGQQVVFTSNGSRLFLANGGKVHVWDGSLTSLVERKDDWPRASHVAWINGKVVLNDLDEQVIRFTDYQAPRAAAMPVLSSEYFNAEANPDEVSAVYQGWGEVLLFGPRSLEFWQDAGSEGVPFERISGAYVERGVSAPRSVALTDNTWFFLDNERQIIRLEGRTPKVISLPYKRLLQNLTAVEDAYGFLLHDFYVLTFPTADVTLAYNLVTGKIARWSYTSMETGQRSRYLGQSAAYVPEWGQWVVGGRDGTLYVSHRNLATDNGALIRCFLRTAVIDQGSANTKIAVRLTVRFQRGQPDEQGSVAPPGLSTDWTYGAEDALQIRWRNDGGAWSAWQTLPLGALGDLNMIRWLAPMGGYRTRQYELLHANARPMVVERCRVGRVHQLSQAGTRAGRPVRAARHGVAAPDAQPGVAGAERGPHRLAQRAALAARPPDGRQPRCPAVEPPEPARSARRPAGGEPARADRAHRRPPSPALLHAGHRAARLRDAAERHAGQPARPPA